MLLFLLAPVVLCYDLYPTVDELAQYSLHSIFGAMNDPQYEIIGSAGPIRLIDSVYRLGDYNHTESDSIKSARSNKLNDLYTFLDEENVLYWTESTLISETPIFNHRLNLTATPTCYDSDFIDDITLIVDCLDSKGSNLFYLVQMHQDTFQSKLAGVNILSPSALKLRKINVLDGNYLFLGQATKDLSLIEVFNLTNFDKMNATLNSAMLLRIASIRDKSYKFKLIDFVIRFNIIYVLDESRLFVFTFDSEWRLNTQLILPSKAIAFDVNIVSYLNGGELFELAVLTVTGKLLYFQDFVNVPQEMTVTGTRVQISNQFIVVSNQEEITLINIHDSQIVRKTKLDSAINLVSPLSQSMIVVTPKQAQKFMLSFGYLSCYSPQETQSLQALQIKATSGQSNKVINFQYQILNKQDQKLYPISEPILFKNAITNDFYSEIISPFLSGPNIQYQSDKQNITLQFNVIVNQEAAEFPKQIIYQDVLAVTFTSSLIIFQLKDFSLSLWGCNTYSFLDDCEYLQFEYKDLTTALTRLTFQWWEYNDEVFIAIAQKNKVDVWELKDLQLKHLNTMQSFGKKEVKQILALNNHLFVLLSTGEIQVYQNGALIETIEPAEPALQIFGNPYHSSQILIIKTANTIIVTRYYITTQVIEYFSQTGDVYVAIYDDTFILVTSKSIEEYSLNLCQISLLKAVPLYGYQIAQPLMVEQSKHNGLLFVVATSQILIFKPTQLAHDQLYQVIDISGTSISLLSVDGSISTELFYHDQIGNVHKLVMENPQVMAILPTTQSTYYYTTVQQSFTAGNSITNNTYDQNLNIVNRMERIHVKEGNSEVKLGSQNQTEVLYIGDDWYSGQVVSFRAQCKQCPDEITLNQPVSPYVHNLFGDSGDVKVVTKYDDDHFIVITDKQLIISDINFKSTSSIYLGQLCYQVAVHPQEKYIVLACYHEKQSTILMVECKGAYSCSIATQKVQPFSIVDQMVILTENLLLVTVANAIQVYSINSTEFTLQQTIITKEFQETCNGVNYFLVSLIYTDTTPQYLISILDQEGYIIFLFTEVKNNQLKILSNSVQSLYVRLQAMNMYAVPNSRYVQILQIGQVERDLLAHIKIKFILVSNNTATYAFRFIFDQTSAFYYSEMLFIINQYGDWTTLNKAYKAGQNLVIAYSNGVKNVLLTYSLPSSYESPILSQVQTITSIGGITDTILSKDYQIIAFIFWGQEGYKLLSNIVRQNSKIGLSGYSMSYCPQLVVVNTINLDTRQTINILLQNDFSTAVRQVQLKELLGPVKPSSNIGWVITAIVLASLISGSMFIFVMRRRAIRLSYSNYQPMGDQQMRAI